jgi:hypothetical protein
MKNRTISRRTVLRAGGCALVTAPGVARMASASAKTGMRSKSQELVRQYYAAWETKDWDTQIAYIDRFELRQVVGTDNEAFVMYVRHTANGRTFQNVEYFQLRKEKVRAVECYFGGKSSFPSAASTGKG